MTWLDNLNRCLTGWSDWTVLFVTYWMISIRSPDVMMWMDHLLDERIIWMDSLSGWPIGVTVWMFDLIWWSNCLCLTCDLLKSLVGWSNWNKLLGWLLDYLLTDLFGLSSWMILIDDLLDGLLDNLTSNLFDGITGQSHRINHFINWLDGLWPISHLSVYLIGWFDCIIWLADLLHNLIGWVDWLLSEFTFYKSLTFQGVIFNGV